MRLGLARFHDPTSVHSSAVMVARLRYLEVIERHHQGLFEKIEQLSFPSRKTGTYFNSPIMMPDYSQLDELFASLNLPDDGESNYWFREPVLAYWSGVRLTGDGTRTVGISGDVTTGPKMAFELTHEEQGALQRALDTYAPTQCDNRANALKEALKVMKESFKRHFDEVDAAHLNAGFLETPSKRNHGDPLLHLEWVYLTHIGEQGERLTQGEVVKRFGVDEANVSKATSRLK